MPSPSDPGEVSSGHGLRQRVESLVEEGDWAGVHESLVDSDRGVLLADPGLAYRFAEALYFTGRIDELADFASAFEAHAQGTADIESMMRALNLAGIAAFELGRVTLARAKFDALMGLSEAELNEEMVARAANNLGAIANLKGHRHEALAYYQLASTIYQRLDVPRGLAQTHHNIGVTFRDLGQYEEASDAYAQAIRLSEGLSHEPLAAVATIGRAEAKVLQGDAELGTRMAERGLELARRIGDPLAEAEALKVRALAALEASGRETPGVPSEASALADLETARGLAQRSGNRLLEAEVERDLGRLLIRLGRVAEGRALLERAASCLEALGATAELRALRKDLERLP
jgi:tetratricopeptide (TPR) repeat protein